MHCPIGVKVAQIQTGGYTGLQFVSQGLLWVCYCSTEISENRGRGYVLGSTRITIGGTKRGVLLRLGATYICTTSIHQTKGGNK